MKIDESIFTIWKQHAAAAKQGTTMIRFEDWIEGKEARNAISKSLGLENLDHTNTMSHHGSGSSFNPHHWTPPSDSDVNNRRRQVELSKALLERMQQEDIQVAKSQLGYHEQNSHSMHKPMTCCCTSRSFRRNQSDQLDQHQGLHE